MVRFNALIKKFASQGEKTGWTYIEIPAEIAGILNPDRKTSFPVKGSLDNYMFFHVALLPMGGGSFIMPLKNDVRKKLGKRKGAFLDVKLQLDTSEFVFSEDFIACLQDEPQAFAYFKSLPLSHQKYFSKWIDSAKTDATKTKRIVLSVKSLQLQQGYGEMIRANKKEPK